MGTVLFLGGIGLIVLVAATAAVFIWRYIHPTTTNGQGVSNSWLNRRLEEEKSQSDIILNAIGDGVVVVDDQKVIRLINPAGARTIGWAQEEATGLSHTAVLKLLDAKGQPFSDDQNPLNRVLMTGKNTRDNNAQLTTKSNKTLSINLSVSPLMDQNQRVSGIVAIFSDVSEERQEERQRAEFISTASHEMRTPVAAIEGYLALALNEKVSRIDLRAREYLKKAHESTQHLGQLFQDLLTSAKAEDGRLSNHPEIIEMSTYLERLVEDLRFSAQKKSLNIDYVVGNSGNVVSPDTPGSKRVVQPLYYVYAYPERLREVITNLFDNAVKFTQKGTISLGLTGDKEVVQMYVRDTGGGIAPEDIPHLFQKFYRIDNSATRTIGGTGLGLFISRKIIELYNGRIWVESEVTKGSTFYINLPRVPAETVSEKDAEKAKQTGVQPTATA